MTRQAGKLDLNLMQTTGSALAALSSAVLLSTLGATGTLVGAAVGSIVVTVGGAVYSHYLSVSRQRMAAARNAALVRASRAGRSGSTSTDGSVAAVTRALAEAPERFPLLAASARGGAPGGPRPGGTTAGGTTAGGATPRGVTPATTTGAPGQRLIDGYLPGTPTSLRQILRGLRWKRALAVSLGVFVVVVGAIVSMELATGRALSSYTGGSSADGPRTSIALLSSTSDAGGSDSTATDPSDGGTDQGSAGAGDTTGSGARSQGAGDTASGSTAGSERDTDAPQTDTSTTEPGVGTPTGPAPEPTPDSTEPAPQPSPAPSTQAPVEAPAPRSGAAVSGAVADSAS